MFAELKPLESKLLPVEPFNLELLPESLQPWIQDISERMDNQPYDYAAIGAMVALGSLLGRKVGVHPKRHDDWLVIPNLWGVVIGRPSAKKTPTLNEAKKPLVRLETEARKACESELREHKVQLTLCKLQAKEAETKAAKLMKKDNVAEAKAELEKGLSEPETPVQKRYVVNDASIEKLGELLAENPMGLLVFRDELTGWLKTLNREDRGNDRAFYLEAFNGLGSYTYDRIGRGTIHIPSNTVSILGGIQPGKLQPYLIAQQSGSGDDGLLQRFQLMVYPDQGTFRHVDRWPDNKAQSAADEVFDRLNSISDSESEIPALRFSNEAQTLFDEWYCELMARCRQEPEHIEAHLAKYPSLLPSLALIIHMADQSNTDCIGLESVQKAAAWCEYLESHARRVYGLIGDPLYGARSLARRFDQLPNPFSAEHIKNQGWSGLSSSEERSNALRHLCDHGHLYLKQIPTASKPRIEYHINPKALED